VIEIMAPDSGSKGHPPELVIKTVSIGGVAVTLEQVSEAIKILQEDKSTQVKLPLKHRDNPLWQTDYHSMSDAYYDSHPKLPPGSLKEHVAHVKNAFITELEQQLEKASGNAEDANSVTPPGQLIWTREEIILAMDLYVKVGGLSGGPIPGQNSTPIIELSDLLKKLSAYPPEVQGSKYRNPNGVYLKLMNLRAIEAGAPMA
jgi:hypothetical protein